jgi:SP family general alpha glucoside:H+ symporter-like MFS transporter
MSWSIGGIIVAAATYGTNNRQDQWAWRLPLALQWIFPVSYFFLALYLQALTSPDPTFNPHLFRPRVPMVAYSSRA